ncbi:pyrophosphatase [Pseudomonas phage UNO-G1W1]|uniref:Pyrophosphatase n=1 Tax=Pseudomonas phage UNO-G1W1 TaxID=3136609 RepID=A0AAX4MUX1_9CAUD
MSINNLEVYQVANIHSCIALLQDAIYKGNVTAGWWKNIVTGEPHAKGDITLILSKLALVHSEVSEATEGVRKALMDDKLPHRPMPEVELADAIIRAFDLAGHEGWDLAGAIIEKLYYNDKREDHKIENRLKEGGKQA